MFKVCRWFHIGSNYGPSILELPYIFCSFCLVGMMKNAGADIGKKDEKDKAAKKAAAGRFGSLEKPSHLQKRVN